MNWWGTTAVAVSTVQGGEPGYSAQIPVAFGGTATAPGGQPDIKGTSSANIDYDPIQCSGVDTSAAVGFQPSGVLCAPPVTTIVTASSMTATGWVFYNDETDVIDPTLGSFVTGPGTPALGTGSAQISVSGTQRRNLASYQFAGTTLANISALRFRTYNPSAGNGGSATRSAYLNFNVDFNGSDTFQRRLVFVPRQNGTVIQNTWQEWDAINGGAALWSYSGPTWPITLQPGTTLKTWAQILSDYPGVRIRVTDAFVGLRVGEPYPDGYTENIDSFTFGSPAGTTIFNFEDTPQCTSICYVNGTTGNDAFDGSTPTSPKKTIQGGVNQVSVGGTVQVAAGTYNENVTITKELTLAGAGETTTIVRPAVSNPNCGGAGGGSLCAGGSNIILVQADNVTIHDIGLNGDNPALPSGAPLIGGADIDARNGIITNHALGVYQNLVVHHTTVKNIYLRGIYASSGGSFNFHHDTVQNVQGNTSSIGMFNFGGAGAFTNNNVSNTNDGIASNHSSGTQFLNNTVTNSGSGVHTDNAGDGGGVADLIKDNIVTNSTYGVWVFVPYIAPTLQTNTITNVDVGLAAFGQGAAVTTNFIGNIVDGQNKPGSTGAYVTTDQLGFGFGDSSASFTGNRVVNNVDGFYLDAVLGGTVNVTAATNCIAGNTNSGMTATASVTAVNAENNWWGRVDGPSPIGHGDKVDPTSTIDAVPFLTAPVAGCPVPADGDGDGINDPVDNCPTVYNPGQENRQAEPVPLPKPFPPYDDATNPIGDSVGDACENDIDHDGLTNAQEIALGTSPYVPDTDGDRTNDGTEVACGSDPLNKLSNLTGTDTDHDTLPDACEAIYGTNPNAVDTDGDHVLDGVEVRYWMTNPLIKNSDGDDCTDNREIASGNDDRKVNSTDQLLIAKLYGSVTPDYGDLDTNGDGKLNSTDQLFIALSYGPCTPS